MHSRKLKHKIPPYLAKLLPKGAHSHNTRNSEDIAIFKSRTETLNFSFFPWYIVQWSSSYLALRNYLIKRNGPLASPTYIIHNRLGMKLLTSLRLGPSHFNEHRFSHNFENCLNLLCTCSSEVELTTHFFLHCHNFDVICLTFNNSLKAIDKGILTLSDNFLTKVILYGDSKYIDIQNHDIINSTITYILDSKHFG